MKSFVEVKDECLDKASELIEAIDVSDDDCDRVQASKAVETLVNAAATCVAQANNDAWGPKKPQGLRGA